VTFYLCQPATVTTNGGNCSAGGTQVGVVKTLSGGTATSDPTATTDTNTDGKYCWRAVYSPDTNTNYIGSSELTSTHECFTVASATIIVQKIIKPTGSTTSFDFNATGTGYVNFSLQGGQTNTQGGLDAGSYSAMELVPSGWVLTGIGGSTDINTPYNCTVSGTGGSTGIGDLNSQTVTISLKLGDTVTCVFENTGQNTTRTQGFWATHPQLAVLAWFGGTGYGHTFPGVASVTGIGDTLLCGRPIDTLAKLMGGFWSGVSKTSTGDKRSQLDQARMQLLQQLLAAELNASAFGSLPSGGSGQFAVWEAAFCGSNLNAIKTAASQAASFNEGGDSGIFTPGTSADSKTAKAIAAYSFWDVLPAG
jgi:hypothetical protein